MAIAFQQDNTKLCSERSPNPVSLCTFAFTGRLALCATSSIRKQMGLPFHLAAKQETFHSLTASNRQPRAAVEEHDRNWQAFRYRSNFRLAGHQDCICTLSSYPKLSIFEKLEMLTSGTNAGNGTNWSGNLSWEKSLVHIIQIPAMPRPCLLQTISFLPPLFYSIFWCKFILNFYCVAISSYILNVILLFCCINTTVSHQGTK